MTQRLDDYRILGGSGLRVSPLCLGTMTFGTEWGWGAPSDECRAMLDRYIGLGGNFIDTANNYTGGASERILGELLGDRRESVVLATKYSLSMRERDPNCCGNHRRNLVQSLEASLGRLKTDRIDLLYIHIWAGKLCHQVRTLVEGV
jgi:aryl-alcohol dehydrogenase-like predicted oxidoreductase